MELTPLDVTLTLEDALVLVLAEPEFEPVAPVPVVFVDAATWPDVAFPALALPAPSAFPAVEQPVIADTTKAERTVRRASDLRMRVPPR